MSGLLTGSAVLRAALWLALALPALAPTSSLAETAWVKDELRLNLRTGPGTEFRIIGVMSSGDSVGILKRKEGWTQVQPSGGESGWIPEGYLQPEVPDSVKLAERDAQVASLQDRMEAFTEETLSLRSANDKLSTRDTDLSAEMERLARENQAYRAAADWGEMIAGAVILCIGMVVGWALKSSASRRHSSRVRL